MTKVSKVVNNLISESLIPARIQRLNALMNILLSEEQHSLTVNELINLHASLLGLPGRSHPTALRIIRRDLEDLQNEGQIQSVSCRPKRFFKTSYANASVISNPSQIRASNDDSAPAPLCNLSLVNRVICDVDVSISTASTADHEKINVFLEIIRNKRKADFFYLSRANEFKSNKPINVSVNVVGIIVKLSGIYLVKATFNRNIQLFDIQGITDIKSTQFRCNALNEDSDAEKVMQKALSMTNALGVDNSLKYSKTRHSPKIRR